MREHAVLGELQRVLADYSAAGTARKRALLATIAAARLARAADLRALQRVICFLRAFPDDAGIARAAQRLAGGFAARMARLPARERARLDDSGSAGTVTRHI
jgi:hypothetical protein